MVEAMPLPGAEDVKKVLMVHELVVADGEIT
jgi:hypothetical protein